MKRILLITLSLAFLIFSVLTLAGSGSRAFTVTAHRGGAFLGNENTVSCILKGIATGADAVEIDVHQSADGALIVCHDPTLDRTTDHGGRIEDLTLAEIRQARIKDAEGNLHDETVPTLEEVLAVVKGQCNLLLEVKRNRKDQYPGIEARILAAIDSAQMRESTVFQSFDDLVLENFHALDPTLRLEKLLVMRLPFGLCFDMHLTRFSLKKYHYIASFNIHHSFATRRFIRRMHAAGKEVKVWTVNDTAKLPAGVDGVITNDPRLFL